MLKRAGLFIFLLAISGFDAAAGPSLELRDLKPGDQERLHKELPQLFNAPPDQSTLDEAIGVLMINGAYENVIVDRDAVGNYTLIAKPLRVVEEIRFKGTDEVSENELRELLDFKTGDRFDRKKAVSAGEKMKEYYSERGFFNTVIEISFNKTESKNLSIFYEINEKAPCRILGLVFESPNVELKANLAAHFQGQIKKELTAERVRELMLDLHTHLINQGYITAEVTGPDARYNPGKTEAYLQVEIREPYRWEFYPSAQSSSTSEGDLRTILDMKNLERKNIDPALEGAERLRRDYLEKGFPFVRVETKASNPAGTYLKRVYHTVTEGTRVKIKNIDLQGRLSRSSKYYENFILTNSSELIAKKYYSRLALENGFKNLVTELHNQGYLRAKVLSSRADYSEKKDSVVIHLNLEEGPQTQVRAVEFDGNHFFSNFELSEVSGLKTNMPLKLNTFEESIEKVKTFYLNQGFLEMKLLNEGEDLIQYNETGTQARILFKLFEGPRIRVNSVAVEGNTFTKTRVIVKEADFQIGEVLTPTKIEDAIARLNKLGLFSRVDIRTLEDGTNVAERTVIISVSERDPGIFRIGPGISNERGLTVRGFVGLGYNNLWGTGRAISGRVEVKSNVGEVNYPEHEVTAGYLEPFIFNTRTRGRVILTRSERVFEYQSEHNVTKITTSNRVDFSAERDLTRHTKMTWKAWSLESRKEFEREGRCINVEPFNPGAGKCPPSVQQIATFGPILDVDYRDSPFLPTQGSFTRLNLDYSHPNFGSTDGINFVRSELNYSYHLRLGSPRWVWANSARGGYVANLSHDVDSGVPTSYAFFLGGIYTLRGFDLTDRYERLPREGDDGFVVENGNQLLIRQDSHYYLFKSELRFPIYDAHGGVLFYDGGAVLVTGYHFDRPYRDSVGIGYRYNTPVGPLAIDLAFKINPRRDEDKFRVLASIGTF